MRIRYLSDLHMEFTDYLPSTVPSVGEDLVILAGDIGVGIQGVRWARSAFGNTPVLYVMGNHEYYRNHFVELVSKAKTEAIGSNVHILEDESIVINGIRFLGCAFWTDFKLFGSEMQSRCMQVATEMNDYLQILTGPLGMPRRISPADTMHRHNLSRAWLDREISSSNEPCVVITHHGPSYKVCVAEYQNDFLTSAFLNKADDLLRAPVKAWIFGHTHQVFNLKINGVAVMSNQRGYPSQEVPRFSWDTCFDISAETASPT